MPSLLHEELVELLRREPLFALEALRRSGVLQLPPFTSVAIIPSEIRQLLPTERRADIVVLLRGNKPVFVLVIEVQLGIDTGKHVAWPIYLVTLRAEYDCPVALVVFAVDPAVQRWAQQTIDLGHPGFRLTPLVVGPDEIPRITDPAEARAAPYRAILSALVHALEPGAEQLVVAAFEGADTLPGEDADTWRELLQHAIQNNEVARLAVEALMDIQDFRDKSVWFKEGREAGQKLGLEAGQKLGLEAGQKLGLEAGQKLGHEAGLRAAIERVLLRRGLDLPTAQRAQLEACHDLPTLERWHDQAITAASAEEALG